MFFIYASLLEFVFVNYIGRKRPRRPADLAGPTIQVTLLEKGLIFDVTIFSIFSPTGFD